MRVLRRRLCELPSKLRELRERHHERAHHLLVALDKEYRDAERSHNESGFAKPAHHAALRAFER
jgi:hypothetical protein